MRRGTGLKGLAKSIAVLVGLWVTVGVVGAYAGIEPFVSYGEVVKGQAVWLTSQHVQSDEPAYPRARQLFRTYTTFVPLLNMEQRMVFRGDTLT